MKGYTIGRALLLAVTALLLAAATASTASARMAPPETALLQPSTSVTPGVKLAIDVPAKNKHHHAVRHPGGRRQPAARHTGRAPPPTRRASTRGHRLVEVLVGEVGRLVVRPWHQVAVTVERDRDGRVSHDRGERLRVHTGRDQQRRERMTALM